MYTIMPICFLLPGVGGSTLGRSPNGADAIWVSPTQLALGQIGRLRLAADGLSPGGSDGVQLYAGPPLADYYDVVRGVLAIGLQPHGYTVVAYGYDWRLSAKVTGLMLAGAVRASVAPVDPCTIVAHSFGGLVARVAWQVLGVTGQQDLVRRIVTLGTPHWGAVSTVGSWAGTNEVFNTLFFASLPSQPLGLVPGSGVPLGGWTQQLIARVANSWPSVYELGPSLFAPDAADDPLRAALYSFAWPQAVGVRPDLLTYARDVWQPYLAGADTQPPPWVLTCVAGRGLPTSARVAALSAGAVVPAIVATGDGDGTVVLSSALGLDGAHHTVSAAHTDLDQAQDYDVALVGEVLDERHPPQPAPPPVVIDNPLVIRRQPPPFPAPCFAQR